MSIESLITKIKKHWISLLFLSVAGTIAILSNLKQDIQVISPTFEKKERRCKMILDEFNTSFSQLTVSLNGEADMLFLAQVQENVRYLKGLISESSDLNCELSTWKKKSWGKVKSALLLKCYQLVNDWHNTNDDVSFIKKKAIINKFTSFILGSFNQIEGGLSPQEYKVVLKTNQITNL